MLDALVASLAVFCFRKPSKDLSNLWIRFVAAISLVLCWGLVEEGVVLMGPTKPPHASDIRFCSEENDVVMFACFLPCTSSAWLCYFYARVAEIREGRNMSSITS